MKPFAATNSAEFTFKPEGDQTAIKEDFFMTESRTQYPVDNIGHLAHLHARDTSLALVSRASLDQLAEYLAKA